MNYEFELKTQHQLQLRFLIQNEKEELDKQFSSRSFILV